MFFASDNGGPVHPAVMAALERANRGHAMPYGADPLTAKAVARVRDAFEAPQAAVFLVSTGTAANALALATLAQPFQRIYCSPLAHIQNDECNAPEFHTGGAKIQPVGNGRKISATALREAMEATPESVHAAQRGPVSVTQVTEMGEVYSVPELRELCKVAEEFGQRVHMDGARITNAVAALGCSPAEMTWKAGVDAVSFGGTKNGLMAVEAVVLFDPALGREFELRRKRAAHLWSKHRYLASQMDAYLTDGLWLEMANASNEAGKRLAEGLRDAGADLVADPQANMVFARLPRETHARLRAAGAQYYLNGPEIGDPGEMVQARFVCDWSIANPVEGGDGKSGLDQFLELLGTVTSR